MTLLSRFRRFARRAVLVLVFFGIADAIYLVTLWPDWSRLAKGGIPRSNFIARYEQERIEKHWPQLAWQPVALGTLPRHVVRAVIVAEDSSFYTHSGLDLAAVRDAWEYNWARGRLAFGASTISQQTAKNLFLSPARTPVRKWHELVLTAGLETHLSKSRILEIYLNVAEFGRGIYGVEAAARAYWGIPATQLSIAQAAELAATLPGPVKHNPATRTRYFERHSKKILSLLARDFDVRAQPAAPADLANVPPERDPPPPDDEDLPPTEDEDLPATGN